MHDLPEHIAVDHQLAANRLDLEWGQQPSPGPFSGWHPDKNAAWRHQALQRGHSNNILIGGSPLSQTGWR